MRAILSFLGLTLLLTGGVAAQQATRTEPVTGIRDNGTGCDHGSGGVAFAIGGQVNGGLYGAVPSLEEKDQSEGDLHFNNDFRSSYATILDRWLGLDPDPIVNGQFEQFGFIGK